VRIIAAMLWTWAGITNAAATGDNRLDLERADGYFAIVAQASTYFGEFELHAMTIDIKPGDAENIVRTSAGRVIPVAILGSKDLDVTAINPRTIRLNGVDVMLVGKSDKSLCRQTDSNDDGYEDLVCDVRTTGFRVSEGEYRIIIKASTYSGETLTGEDSIKIVR